jgi:hypothetical protein
LNGSIDEPTAISLSRDLELRTTFDIFRVLNSSDNKYPPLERFGSDVPRHHLSWIMHLMVYWVYCSWSAPGVYDDITDSVHDSLQKVLKFDPPPSDSILTDCLIVTGLMVDLPLHMDDLMVIDKRYVDLLPIPVLFFKLIRIQRGSRYRD